MIKVSVSPTQFVAGQESELVMRFANASQDPCTDVVFKLGLPPEFLLLEGRSRIEITEILGGRECTRQVVVRPKKAGTFTIGSTNFSYRNGYGLPVRVSDFRADVVVLGDSVGAAETPQVDVTYVRSELLLGEWGALRLRVRNSGIAAVRDLAVSVSGPIHVVHPGPRIGIARLNSGSTEDVSFTVFPDTRGRDVPLHVHSAYTDRLGRAKSRDDYFSLSVVDRTLPANAAVRPADVVLYLAANPSGLDKLKSDRELREIREKLQRGKYRDRFTFEPWTAVRLDDISQALLDFNPNIIHFAGHGDSDGSLYVEDERGCATPLSPEGLTDLFALHAHTVRCVIVNACHSLTLANAMVKHIDYVIGMRHEIGDMSAIAFSIGFYQGLAGGSSFPDAYERGRALMRAGTLSQLEYQTPVLLKRRRS